LLVLTETIRSFMFMFNRLLSVPELVFPPVFPLELPEL
jgi:hypothetical protein